VEPRHKLDDLDEFDPSPEDVQEEVLRSQQFEGDLPDPFEEVFGG
jgi:hypothetical protein